MSSRSPPRWRWRLPACWSDRASLRLSRRRGGRASLTSFATKRCGSIRRSEVADCRDAKDNKYLELALAAGAWAIVSGDRPARAEPVAWCAHPAAGELLAEVEGRPS